jgi:hypothetical protein
MDEQNADHENSQNTPLGAFQQKISCVPRQSPSPHKAQAHATALIRAISTAHRTKNHQRASRLTRIYLGSTDARYAAVLEAYNNLKQHQRPDKRLLWDYAQSLNPWAGTQEMVQLRLQPKKGSQDDFQKGSRDDFRTVMDFGIERRALQYLVRRVLKARADLHPNQYGTRGTHAAITKVAELLAHGYHWAIETDIVNCYPSFDGEAVADHLPIPKRVTHSSLLGASLTLRLSYPNMFGPADPGEEYEILFPELFADARRGLPQGSAASPLAAEMLLAPVFENLPQGGIVLGYADNFLIMAKDENDVMSTITTLWGALKANPVGHFQPKAPRIFPPGTPIEFLGHQFHLTNGIVRKSPTQKNAATFENYVDNGLSKIGKLGVNSGSSRRHVKELRRYVSSWCAEFHLCDGMESNRAKAMDRINNAVPISWKSK